MDAVQNINKEIPVIVISSILLKKNDESDSSESSDSENKNEIEDISLSDMQTLFFMLIASKSRGEKILLEKITDYVDRVIPNYTNIIFKEHFRLYPATLEMVLSLIGPALNATSTIFGKKPISAEKQLFIALWFMATPDSYRSVCVKFGVSKATAFRAVRRVTYTHFIASHHDLYSGPKKLLLQIPWNISKGLAAFQMSSVP
ncbi:uncharacterized protein LOC143897598 [Temnothorax americanus]|uniref:uncharacterized protein LOC143897598 n=1 Tax=Temnothorax americanus TaxID=1964332 RepID=UPI004067D872